MRAEGAARKSPNIIFASDRPVRLISSHKRKTDFLPSSTSFWEAHSTLRNGNIARIIRHFVIVSRSFGDPSLASRLYIYLVYISSLPPTHLPSSHVHHRIHAYASLSQSSTFIVTMNILMKNYQVACQENSNSFYMNEDNFLLY